MQPIEPAWRWHFLHAVRGPLAVEVVPLHHAGGAAALGGADDVDGDLGKDESRRLSAPGRRQVPRSTAKFADEPLRLATGLCQEFDAGLGPLLRVCCRAWRRDRDQRGWPGGGACRESRAARRRSRPVLLVRTWSTWHGPAWITVTGTMLPASSNICVIPTLRPSSPIPSQISFWSTLPRGTCRPIHGRPDYPHKLPVHKPKVVTSLNP